MRHAFIESHLAYDPVGKIIATATKSDVQHTATVLCDEQGNPAWRYEALVGKGYTKTKYEPRARVVLRTIRMSEEKFDRLLDYHERSVGIQYPKPWYLALEYIIPGLHHMRRSLYCSQAALNGLTYAGLYDSQDALAKPSPGVADAVGLALEMSTSAER